MPGKCSICDHSLGKFDKKEVSTACGHTFHYECAEERAIKKKKTDCPTCEKSSALVMQYRVCIEKALIGTISTIKNHPNMYVNVFFIVLIMCDEFSQCIIARE